MAWSNGSGLRGSKADRFRDAIGFQVGLRSGGVITRGREEQILGATLRDRAFVLHIEPAQTVRGLDPSGFNPLPEEILFRIVVPIAIQIVVAIWSVHGVV